MELSKSKNSSWREVLDLNNREIKGFKTKTLISKKIQNIEKGLSEGIECNELTLEPGVEDIYHYHKFTYDIFRVESGILTVIIDGKIMELEPGDWVLIEPNEKHRIINRSRTQVIVQEVRLYVREGDKYTAIEEVDKDK